MTAPAHDVPAPGNPSAEGRGSEGWGSEGWGSGDRPDAGVDPLALWDAAVAARLTRLTGADFGCRGAPALLLLSAPAPLVEAWASWRGVAVAPAPDGVPGFPLSATVHVAAQDEADTRFLGPDVVLLTAVDGDGAWCPRGLRLGVDDVVRA